MHMSACMTAVVGQACAGVHMSVHTCVWGTLFCACVHACVYRHTPGLAYTCVHVCLCARVPPGSMTLCVSVCVHLNTPSRWVGSAPPELLTLTPARLCVPGAAHGRGN